MKEMSVEMLLPWLLLGSSCLDALSRPPGDQIWLVCQEKSALTRDDQTLCSSLQPGRARRRLLQYFSVEMSIVVMHRSSNYEKMVEEMFTEERRDKVLTVGSPITLGGSLNAYSATLPRLRISHMGLTQGRVPDQAKGK